MYKRAIILKAVFDDSDFMTDYWYPDRTIFEWIILPIEKSEKITEGKLRKALKLLPKWIKEGFIWTYVRPEKYAWSPNYYGRLRIINDTGLFVPAKYTYSNRDKPIDFIITASVFEEGEETPPIPISYEEMKELLNKKFAEWEEAKRRAKENREKFYSEIIQAIGEKKLRWCC
jgi:hypothetical protein